MQDIRSRQKTGIFLTALIFLIAPFFSQPNLGGEGLSVSHNTTVWVAATLAMVFAVYFILKTNTFSYPKYWYLILAMPASVILSGFLLEIFLPYQFLLRELYILGGLFFLFALFQFKFNQRNRETILKIIVLSGIIHALYGCFQILWPETQINLITYSTGTPYSTFQQINIQASVQATTLLISFYLLSRPTAIRSAITTKLLLMTAILLSSFIVAYAGSRVGLLSALTGLTIITVCRWPLLKTRKQLVAICLAMIVIGGFAGAEGIQRTGTKLQQTADESLKDARKNIYAIAIDLFKASPIEGYGIGSFQKVWHEEKVNYLEKHPEASFPPERLSHPHNEMMFWLVEGGLTVVLGILISLIAVVTAALQCGWKRGVTYLAILFPIGLHTQVELPFYISNVPWFLMMALVFLILSHYPKNRTVSMSSAAKVTVATTFLATFITVTAFMVHSIYSNHAIVSFLKARQTQPLMLEPALNNPFFRDQAELYFMRTLLLREAKVNKTEFAPQFIEWAEPYIEYTPVPQLYVDLAQAYLMNTQSEKAVDILQQGLARYPSNENILKAQKAVAQRIGGVKEPSSDPQDP